MALAQRSYECFNQQLIFSPPLPIRKETAADESNRHIDFIFICKPVYRQSRIDSQNNFDEQQFAPVIASASVDIRNNGWDEDEVVRIINEALGCCPLSHRKRREVIQFSLRAAHDIVLNRPQTRGHMHAAFELRIPFTVIHQHRVSGAVQTSEERRDMPNGVEIPEWDSRISECLKKKIIEGDDEDGGCSICLEDFDKGCEGLCTPCSHTFHADCIKRWLKTRRSCPLCRSQIPAD